MLNDLIGEGTYKEMKRLAEMDLCINYYWC